GQISISASNAFIKLSGLFFHSIGPAWFLHSRFGRRSIYIEYECNVRDAITHCERVQALDHFAVQAARRALINSRRIKKTVCDHAYAALKSRSYRFAHELTAAGLEKKQLGFRRHRGIVRRKLEKLANRFADRCAARFAGNQIRNPRPLKTLSEPLYLRRFSTTFRSFKRDEWQPRHDVDSEIKQLNCRTR